MHYGVLVIALVWELGAVTERAERKAAVILAVENNFIKFLHLPKPKYLGYCPTFETDGTNLYRLLIRTLRQEIRLQEMRL
jgi:hypothetical protein